MSFPAQIAQKGTLEPAQNTVDAALRGTNRLRLLSNRRCTARQAAFLHAYRTTAMVAPAAKAARIGRRRHYHWLEQDPDYRQTFEAVRQIVADELEGEAVRRAVEGWLEPIFYNGIQC